MSTHRLRPAMIIATVLGTATVGLAPTASADPQPVGIGVARTDELQHGSFSVPVWTDASGASITAVSATVDDAGAPVTTVDLTPTAGGFWAPAQPLSLTEDGGVMPHLGSYPIDVTATDSAGNTVTRTGAGTLDFTLRPDFAELRPDTRLLSSPATPSYDHHAVSVRGRLQGIQPGSGDAVPLAGVVVTLVRSYLPDTPDRPADHSYALTTTSTGDFTSPTIDQAYVADYTASYTVASTTVHGSALTSVEFGALQTNITITAAADRTLVRPGQRVTIHGTVHRGSAKGPGLAGVPVALSASADQAGTQSVLVKADGAGHFHGAVTALAGSYASWSATAQSPYLFGDPAYGALFVPSESVYVGVHISLAANGRVSAGGQVVPRFQQSGGVATELSRLEYSANGRTNWKTIGSGHSDYGPVSIVADGYVDGYYRLHHPTDHFLDDAASAAVHLHRTPTRFVAITAPTSVAKGGSVTVRATLQDYRSRTWHVMARKHVELFFLPSGSKHFSFVTSGNTSASGRIALGGTATRTGRWFLAYYGDSAHFTVFASPHPVTVS